RVSYDGKTVEYRSLAEIDVRVEEHMLAVASADASSRQGDQTDGRASRRPAFRRTFALPSDVDVKAVSAAYRDGILSVTLPKRPESRPRSIHVE
ncbi:MAG: Hsp20/alpha crystallin family protein, partial [Spirochaetota bacterium]